MTNEVPMNGFSAECLVTSRKDTHKEKERQKKEIHNKIEKRRRWLINEKITELGNLLPDNINRASGLKKGSILKETVEYIKQLRKDQGRVHRLEKKMGETCLEVKQLAHRLEQWEIRMATKGANSGGTGHLQDETYENQDINNSLTAEPAKTREHPSPILQDTPLDMLATESEMMDPAPVWDDESSKFSADAIISLPLIAGVDINDMDYYF
ncbi:transcription factor EC-like [Mercenaria mercenaria]|uniref:transcription factor EC-like n=1 Tax=Mercenaria mercenaria TaxID=6596 RepID=UPI00234ED7C8|nr:transcription factor EC-like [Mercenaria mercenaria]